MQIHYSTQPLPRGALRKPHQTNKVILVCRNRKSSPLLEQDVDSVCRSGSSAADAKSPAPWSRLTLCPTGAVRIVSESQEAFLVRPESRSASLETLNSGLCLNTYAQVKMANVNSQWEMLCF